MSSQIFVGDIVRLSGKTRHGKNRVRENGAFAEIITIDGDGDILSRKICVRHILDNSMWRWIDCPDDEHFNWELFGSSNGFTAPTIWR